MTATLDGTPWIPVSTRASVRGSTIHLEGSDCTHKLWIQIGRFKGPGTYDVAAGDVWVDYQCDAEPLCGPWQASVFTDIFGKTTVIGSGSVTVTAYTPPTPGVEGSGAIEGIFAFTLVENTAVGAPTVTRVMTNGRFGTRFWLVGS